MEIEMSLDRRLTTRLSLAVLLTDDFTQKEEITGKVKIAIPSLELTAVMNPSGYYNFFNIAASPPGRKLQITSDYYMDMESADIIFPLTDPVYPVTLKPGPLYPFPSWATLLRGVVSDAGGNAIPGAAVACGAKGLSTVTSAKGEFVLYFPVDNFPIDQEKETIKITVTPQGGPTQIIPPLDVNKCKTTAITVTI